ncbi:hypothetical protein NCG89_11360 [Spongiibacter taiwanensis]|uniref:hypothetical protein n=1 Tax=Spongiibacter taiwanensis TaxID=1748242 RepID=UPI0020356EE4|nr:hypothetical protein [Spongiibacter taiwanensis]USA42119.1 hypothetical protein NCG89_11360 [Spongiibacter taiwanensis]
MNLRFALQLILSLALLCSGSTAVGSKHEAGKVFAADSQLGTAVTVSKGKLFEGDDHVAANQQTCTTVLWRSALSVAQYQHPAVSPTHSPAIRAPPALI